VIVNVHKTTIQWGRGLNRVLSWDYFMRSLSIDWILLFDRLLRSFFSKLLHLNGGGCYPAALRFSSSIG